jgi:pimeloyl-ACP methyl ester carboxylesterase
MAKDLSPATHRVLANGLEHRVLEWSVSGSASRTVFLLHGYMDAAGTWDRVAPTLASHGLRVLAPDMRGFGDSDRAPRGSYYHFYDYVADLAGLVAELSPNEPVALVGHSMGGTIATLYAGAFPEKVVRLASLEGLGPPDHGFEAGPTRVRAWITGVVAQASRPARATMTKEDALRRLVMNHPTVPRDVLESRLPHLVREVGEGDLAGQDGLVWRVDPLHKTTSPGAFLAKLFIEFARRVTSPVLFVSGGTTGFHPPDEDDRIGAFANLERATLEGAGHMLHWTRPRELADLLLSFLSR